MRNPVKGEAPLVLSDGRRFKLVLDIEAIVDAEAAYGKPTQQMMVDAQAGFLGALGALLQGALQRHNPVTRAEALAMLATDMQAVQEALSEAGKLAEPEPSTEGNAAKAASPRAGKTSGRSGAKQA